MALLNVGYTANKLVILTVTDGDVVTQIPMPPEDARQLADHLRINADESEGIRQWRLILPFGQTSKRG